MMVAAVENQKCTLNRLELKMEVVGEFVKKHPYWEYSKGGKNYIAEIVGLSREYGYQRRFLNSQFLGQEKHFLLADFVPGHLYEVVSIYYISRNNPHPRIKNIFECVSIGDAEIVLKEVFDSEVVARFSGRDPLVVPRTLVKQLLREVSKEDALALVREASV